MTVDLTGALTISETSSMFIHDLRKIAELAENCQRIIELGCYWGRSTRAMLDSSNAHIWCVDHWDLPLSEKRRVDGKDYGLFLARLADVRDRITVLKMDTLAAAMLLPNEDFDLIVSDAAHEYEAMKLDLRAYGPLLRDGGIFCGHDYRPDDGLVSRAIDELVKEPHVLKGGVVWWAEKKPRWLRT